MPAKRSSRLSRSSFWGKTGQINRLTKAPRNIPVIKPMNESMMFCESTGCCGFSPTKTDVINYDPDKLPLFVGLSVTPTVDLRSAPTGPNAGKFLQAPEQTEGSVSPTP